METWVSILFVSCRPGWIRSGDARYGPWEEQAVCGLVWVLGSKGSLVGCQRYGRCKGLEYKKSERMDVALTLLKRTLSDSRGGASTQCHYNFNSSDFSREKNLLLVDQFYTHDTSLSTHPSSKLSHGKSGRSCTHVTGSSPWTTSCLHISYSARL